MTGDLQVFQDEIEVVLKYPGESWAAIGWKPLNDDGKCAAHIGGGVRRKSLKKVQTYDV